MEKVFILRWYGPFLFEQLRTWEISQKNTFNLYLIGGKKKYSKKKIHYYIGKAERYLLSDRLKDKNHHINDFSSINEIWVGTFREVASYIREREETKLDVVNKKNTLLITPELKLDQKLFVEPLTMVITGKDIKKVTVKQGKRKLPVQVTGDKVLFDFDPYGDVIKVTLKSRK